MPLELLGRLRDLRLAARAERVVDLVQRRGDGKRERERDRAEEGEVVKREPGGARNAVAASHSMLGRIAAAMISAKKSRPRTSRSFHEREAPER